MQLVCYLSGLQGVICMKPTGVQDAVCMPPTDVQMQFVCYLPCVVPANTKHGYLFIITQHPALHFHMD